MICNKKPRAAREEKLEPPAPDDVSVESPPQKEHLHGRAHTTQAILGAAVFVIKTGVVLQVAAGEWFCGCLSRIISLNLSLNELCEIFYN